MISLALRDKILQYIDKEISLEKLEDWVVPKLTVFLKSPDLTDAHIISAIELGLAEISNRNWTEEKFRMYLFDELRRENLLVQVSQDIEIQITSGTNSSPSNVLNLNRSPQELMNYSIATV